MGDGESLFIFQAKNRWIFVDKKTRGLYPHLLHNYLSVQCIVLSLCKICRMKV
jgi:hypothetical protein